MGQKVDINEVILLSDEVKSITKNLQSNFDMIKSNINLIKHMDTFKGEAAKSAKKYFNEFHTKILTTFKEIFTLFDSQLSSHIAIFHAEVDSSESTVIESDYLIQHQFDLKNQYNAIIEVSEEIKKTISSIADISGVRSPSVSNVTDDFVELTQYIQKVDESLSKFTSVGKKESSKDEKLLKEIGSILKDVGKLKEKGRFTSYYDGSANSELASLGRTVALLSDVKTGYTGQITSYKMYRAAEKAGLRTETFKVNGEKFYRVLATRGALDIFGIVPDAEAERQLNYLLPKNGKKLNAKQLLLAEKNTAVLKYASKKEWNKVGWSKSGKALIEKYTEMAYWNDRADGKYIAKTVGKETIKGAGSALKEAFDVKAVAKSGSKILGPIGAGLGAYSNYHDAMDDGLNVEKAAARTVADTVMDMAVGGAVQSGSVALFSLIIPIPGVGTAVGFAAGIALNHWLNNRSKDKYGRENKDSKMDFLKSWYH